ncbi:MAG: hypothetical protein GX107_01205 [Clostridiales bacterium]|nr:hypothetical protein [Clostridiales bacterium]
MLGYVRAYKPELRFREYDLYRGVYCSICKRLLRLYSPFAQLFLSYDVTLLAIVLAALRGEDITLKKSRCPYNPFKRCDKCLGADKTIDFCADVSVIMAYHKLRDNLRDSGFFGKAAAFLAFPVVFLMHKKASKCQPEAERIVERAMSLQNEVEKDKCASIDAAADPSARALSELLDLGVGAAADSESVRRLGYLIGRYVYVIDAVDDIESDIKSGGFNPLLSKYKELKNGDFYEYALAMLNLNIGEIVKTFKSIEFDRYGDIIYNILFYGLYNSSIYVLKKHQKGGAQNAKSI